MTYGNIGVKNLTAISNLGSGIHRCGWFRGYITISKEDRKTRVLWTSGKINHDIIGHSSISIEFTQLGEITSVYKSVITMHRVDEPVEIQHCLIFISKKIMSAWKRMK